MQTNIPDAMFWIDIELIIPFYKGKKGRNATLYSKAKAMDWLPLSQFTPVFKANPPLWIKSPRGLSWMLLHFTAKGCNNKRKPEHRDRHKSIRHGSENPASLLFFLTMCFNVHLRMRQSKYNYT